MGKSGLKRGMSGIRLSGHSKAFLFALPEAVASALAPQLGLCSPWGSPSLGRLKDSPTVFGEFLLDKQTPFLMALVGSEGFPRQGWPFLFNSNLLCLPLSSLQGKNMLGSSSSLGRQCVLLGTFFFFFFLITILTLVSCIISY